MTLAAKENVTPQKEENVSINLYHKTRPRSGTQAARLLELLEAHQGGKVSLPQILALGIAQYNTRIFELRHDFGFRIENGSEPGNSSHTWFRLVDDPTPNFLQPCKKPQAAEGVGGSSVPGGTGCPSRLLYADNTPCLFDLSLGHKDLG